VDRGEVVHTGSLALALNPGADVIASWLAALHKRGDVFLSLDPNVRPSLVLDDHALRERLERIVSLATLVKVSDEDLRTLDPGAEPMDTAARWLAMGPELIVVTHGAHGSTALVAGAQPLHRDARAAHVVDTVGAGDAFTAGLLTFLAEHDALAFGLRDLLDSATLGHMLDFAGCVAALTCERAGADPPMREAVGEALPAFAVQGSG
jgi:fructokinase